MKTIELSPIGFIETPFHDLVGMPIQSTGAEEVKGRVIVDSAYEEGLADIDGFSHLILLYCFHQSNGYELKVTPFLDDRKRGLFSTRAPRRPNPIGMTVVRLLSRDGCRLTVQGIDVLNGTPLLDIKPYVPKFDSKEVTAVGWLEKRQEEAVTMTSDDRFLKKNK